MTRARLVLLSALCLAASGCGSEPAPADTHSDLPVGMIRVAPEGGTAVEFRDFKVSCPDNAENQWGQKARVVQAVAGSYGTERMTEEDGIVITAGDGIHQVVRMPHSEEWGNYKTFVTAFANRAGDARELSSGEEGASGTIEIIRASCDPKPSLEIRIDGTLTSEIGDGVASVKGDLKLG